ncbi:hypothetical protein GQX73_g10791 [Xylaria multiplex]|uniref:SCP domain-containing protein n=1 Tax=Xylaria multiplex TaxID=323545 RepID=A0A7C8IJL0_9PEZI|nr:hypothetical protein GQX73_g10791 [Xylaria multiplex]
MLLVTPLALLASAFVATAFDVTNLTDGIYRVPILDTGLIDYANAVDLNVSYFAMLEGLFTRSVRTGGSINDTQEGNGDPDNYDDEIDGEMEVLDSSWTRSHCHWHYPHYRNRFISGQTMMNMTNYPLTLAMFMNWMNKGPESGWLSRGEVRLAKANDVVVGACVFKRLRLKTCVHELSLAMGAADRECAAGKVGCHVCLRSWSKDYFRFAATEAPNQCECAWYHY